MGRSVSITRIYRLGDYQDIRITDTMDAIPDEKALNAEYMDTVYSILLKRIEQAYHEYLILKVQIKEQRTDEIVENLIADQKYLVEHLKEL